MLRSFSAELGVTAFAAVAGFVVSSVSGWRAVIAAGFTHVASLAVRCEGWLGAAWLWAAGWIRAGVRESCASLRVQRVVRYAVVKQLELAFLLLMARSVLALPGRFIGVVRLARYHHSRLPWDDSPSGPRVCGPSRVASKDL